MEVWGWEVQTVMRKGTHGGAGEAQTTQGAGGRNPVWPGGDLGSDPALTGPWFCGPDLEEKRSWIISLSFYPSRKEKFFAFLERSGYLLSGCLLSIYKMGTLVG